MVMLISSILFSLSHYQGLANMLLTFFIGILLCYTYYVANIKKYNEFRITALVHSLYNLFIFTISRLFDF